jgi:hypothetical protein
MHLCIPCTRIDISGAFRRLEETISQNNPDEPPQTQIPAEGWHEKGQDVIAASSYCSLCALVIKAWEAHRPEVVDDRLTSGEVNMRSLPRDMYDPVRHIEAYRKGPTSVWVEKVIIGQIQSFLRLEVSSSTRTSADYYAPVAAVFRILLGSSGANATSSPETNA